MEVPLIPVATFQAFLICLARVAALVMAMPVFGSGQVPIQIRVGLIVMVSLLIFPLVNETIPSFPFEPLSLGLLVAREVLVGAMAGFVAQLIFTAVEFCGGTIGYTMGFAAANIFDPTTQQQTQLIGQFYSILAILVFLALDAHHLILQALVVSFWALPPGMGDFGGGAAMMLTQLLSEAFFLGMRIAAPILAILILVNIVLGVMVRVFPQLNVFVLSFPIKIGISFLVMGVSIQILVVLLGAEFGELGERLLAMFRIL